MRSSVKAAWLFAVLTLAWSSACQGASAPVERGGVTVYYRADFDRDLAGFEPVGGADLELGREAISGRALRSRPRQRAAGAKVALDISGSTGLKMAFLARGLDYPEVPVNVYDRRADDNTTSYAPRSLAEDRWSAVVYHLDTFRYNSQRRGRVEPETEYANARFYLRDPTARSELLLDNLVIYRGDDRQPPSRVTDLEARASRRGVDLSWSPADDNVAPMLYVVARRRGADAAFVKVAETHEPRWSDPAPGSGEIGYRVLAADFERNLGPWSEPVSVTASGAVAMPAPGNPQASRHAGWAEAVRAVHRRGSGQVRRGHVCFFGDSLTHAAVYPRLNQARLGIFTVAAHGYSRKTTGFGRETVGEVLEAENPEFLLVLFGTNNLRRGMPGPEQLAQAMADLEAIVGAAHQRGTVAVLGTVPPRGFDDPASKPEATFNDALRQLGRRLGVPVAPIFEELQAAGERESYFAKDGIHWNAEGMRLAADAWTRTMAEVEWVLRDQP